MGIYWHILIPLLLWNTAQGWGVFPAKFLEGKYELNSDHFHEELQLDKDKTFKYTSTETHGLYAEYIGTYRKAGDSLILMPTLIITHFKPENGGGASDTTSITSNSPLLLSLEYQCVIWEGKLYLFRREMHDILHFINDINAGFDTDFYFQRPLPSNTAHNYLPSEWEARIFKKPLTTKIIAAENDSYGNTLTLDAGYGKGLFEGMQLYGRDCDCVIEIIKVKNNTSKAKILYATTTCQPNHILSSHCEDN